MKRIINRVIFLLKAFCKIQKSEGIPSIPSYIDYLVLFLKYRLSAEEYINYRFDKCNKEFRDTFLPYAKAEEYWTILNPGKNAILARDKFIGHALLDSVKVPTSILYFAYDEETSGDDNEFVLHNKEQVISRIKDLGITEFVAKPAADSAHGVGVGVYKVDDFVEFGGTKSSVSDILKGKMILFESLIKQTGQMASINKSSVNTVRMMTALYPNNEVKLMAAFIKIGRAGSCVDNAGSGGNVDCAVNLETGELYNALQFNSWKDIQKIEKHPDSGVQLNGLVINNWSEIKKRVLAMQGQIPYLKTIGWDVALTDNGPVIIEINNWWDTTGQLFLGKGWHSEVKACYDAWVKYYKDHQK